MEREIDEILAQVKVPELAGSGDSIQVGLMIGVGIDLIVGN